MTTPAKQFDPRWPFPQYDDNGNRLLPPADTRPREEQLLEELGEAPV